MFQLQKRSTQNNKIILKYVFITYSGPGYGLQLSLNIEQYEYTKDMETGVGIKVSKEKNVILLATEGRFRY